MTLDTPIDQPEFNALLELIDHGTMREVVAIFAASCPERLLAMRDSLAAGDLPAVATTYHTMRSGCGQLGARDLEDLCALGEQAAKAGRADEATRLLETVEAETARVLAWFRAQGWMDA